MSSTNHYAHIDYSKMIAWPKRLAREWAFLSAPLGSLPSRRLLDLGCGTGEHARYFAEKGFEVVACPWRKPEVALGQLALIRVLRGGEDKVVAARALGVVHTTWVGFAPFHKEYKALEAGGAPGKGEAPETAHCFRELFKAIRGAP